MRITSAVLWTSVRKYASLLRRLTSRLSVMRSRARAACEARTSNVVCSTCSASVGAPT